jgi:L-alanine-DL-glutamate epimerase-like enolase superfamily enzyme
MKFRRVTADWLHVPIPEQRQHTTDFGRIAAFDSTLVRVETDGGLTGFGEAKAAVGSAGTNAALVTCIERELAPLILGEDARDISRLWDVMYNGSRAHFALARGHAFPVLGRRGLTVAALAGIDMALWDLLGKLLGAGLAAARLGRLGVGRADRGGAYGLRRARPLQGGEDAGRGRRRHARPFDPAGPSRARGPGRCHRPHVRAHGTWTVAEARRFCREVASCNLAWLEEPVCADDKRGQAEVRAATDSPIASGESEFGGDRCLLYRAGNQPEQLGCTSRCQTTLRS